MTPMADDLSALRTHTDRLVATVRGLQDPGSATLCEGWTRGHVVTHVARNAEAVGRLADWAVTGTPQPMYPGGAEARDAAIEEGARRPPEALLTDVLSTAQALEPRLAALRGELAAPRVEMRGGLLVDATRLPFLRLREVVFHHVDLQSGFDFGDVEDELLRRFVEDAVERLQRDERAPGLELVSDAGDRWTVGGGGPRVEGSLAGLVLWLARRRPDEVSSSGPLPELPRGA